MKRIRIDVTQEHINEGNPTESGYCPVALALQEHAGWSHANAATHQFWPLFENWDERLGVSIRYDLPVEASSFIQAFDDGDPVEPFSFEVEVRDEHAPG